VNKKKNHQPIRNEMRIQKICSNDLESIVRWYERYIEISALRLVGFRPVGLDLKSFATASGGSASP
jgi:hypothetical protein